MQFNEQIIFREERRIRKWRRMIGVGGSDWKHYVRRKPHVVKRRIRKGIPDCLRGLVWQLISGSRDLLLMNPGVYEVINYFRCDNPSFSLFNHLLPSMVFNSLTFLLIQNDGAERKLFANFQA